MKKAKLTNLSVALLLGSIIAISTSCVRDPSEDITIALYPTEGDIFTDAPVGMGSDFYFPFAPDASNPIGSKFDAFSVDDSESFEGSASIRFDVPNGNDPDGNYAGGIFRIDGIGRNLTGYDAFTFWAKASQSARIAQIGFGEDFGENKYMVLRENIDLTTNWVKYIIPIPDPSKLLEERGMWTYAAAAVGPEGASLGYTFWIDELKFEKLGNIAQPRPAILNGEDKLENPFVGSTVTLSGLTQTFNLASGFNQTVSVAPSYFTFESSNPEVAKVDLLGVVSILGEGSAEITATLDGVRAEGSLTVEPIPALILAPTPTRPASDVISIFSDAYTNVPVDFLNGYWEPWQTTESSNQVTDGNNVISYTNFNFVGNQFANPTVDAAEMTHLHLNMYISGTVPSNLDLLITIKDFGADATEGGSDDSIQQIFFKNSDFVADTWSTLEIPISLTNKNNLGLIIYENVNGSSLSSFLLDNIYFYKN